MSQNKQEEKKLKALRLAKKMRANLVRRKERFCEQFKEQIEGQFIEPVTKSVAGKK